MERVELREAADEAGEGREAVALEGEAPQARQGEKAVRQRRLVSEGRQRRRKKKVKVR
jgi:hypothetical protein